MIAVDITDVDTASPTAPLGVIHHENESQHRETTEFLGETSATKTFRHGEHGVEVDVRLEAPRFVKNDDGCVANRWRRGG